MRQQFRHRQFSAGNPLANLLVVIVGIIVISLSLALGFIVFVGIAGFMLVMAAVISVRAWWLKKKFGPPKDGEKVHKSSQTETRGVIEGEFHEVKSRDSNRD